MGPQSSGKSTLLNHLFGTNFKEMDAYEGRSQTTKGIWMAECAGIEPCTLVMDLEGSDGRERGEDNAFEKQIATIYRWCHDIGREQAANRPLLKIVFQVMTMLFTPNKTTLMLVIRDKTKTPLEKLEPILREDIQKIWDSVPKLEAHKKTHLSDFFNVKVVALSSFERAEEEFKEQVASLRQQFFHSKSPGGLAGDRQDLVPSSAFSFSAHEMWKVIKENKDLDLPSHKILVATLRCQEIVGEISNSFVNNEDWCSLKESVKTQAISGFGERLTLIINTRLSEYENKAAYFDDGVRSAKRKDLEEKLLLLVQPAFKSMLEHIQAETFNDFKETFKKKLEDGEEFSTVAGACTEFFMAKFDSRCADASFQQVNWDASRNKFQGDIDAHITEIRVQKLLELNTSYQSKLCEVLSEHVGILLNEADPSTWSRIRNILGHETASAVSRISAELSSFDVDEQFKVNTLAKLEEFAREVVVSKTRDEAGKILIFMKDRFITLFNHDSNSNPRAWTENDDIEGIKNAACSASVELLACMAAIRLDDRVDHIWETLSSAMLDVAFYGHLLNSETWEEIPLSSTLITPIQCKTIWSQFIAETEFMVKQATAIQDATKRGNQLQRERPTRFAVFRDGVKSMFRPLVDGSLNMLGASLMGAALHSNTDS